MLYCETTQLLTGRKELARETGLNEAKVQRILKYLENEHQIEQQTNNKFRFRTILNWQIYQTAEQLFEHPANSRRTANEQHVNTYKNDKNEENDKNDENYRGSADSLSG